MISISMITKNNMNKTNKQNGNNTFIYKIIYNNIINNHLI